MCVCVEGGGGVGGRGGGGGGVGGKGDTRVFFPLYDSQLEFSRTMNLHRNFVHKHVYTYIYIYTDSNNNHLSVAVHRKSRRPHSCPHLIVHIFWARITIILTFPTLFY